MKNWLFLLVISGLLFGCKSSEVTQVPSSPQVALPPEPKPSTQPQNATPPAGSATSSLTFLYRPAFSPDGKFLAYIQSNSEEQEDDLILINTERARKSQTSGSIRTSIPVKRKFATQLFWSDDSQRIIGTGSGAKVWKIVESKSRVQIKPVVEYGKYNINSLKERNLPAGSLLYHGANVSAKHQIGVRFRSISTPQGLKDLVEVFDLKNEKTRRVLQTQFNGIASNEQLFTFSPTEPIRILTRYNDGSSNWYWTMLDAKNGQKIWARSFRGMHPRMIYSPDGRQLIVSSHQVDRSDSWAKTFPLEILDPQTGKTLRKIEAQETVYATVISKQTLVTIGAETKTRRNSIRVYDWPSGRLKATNPYSGSGMLSALDVALSNDGRTLAILDGELEILGIDKQGKTSEEHWNYYGDEDY